MSHADQHRVARSHRRTRNGGRDLRRRTWNASGIAHTRIVSWVPQIANTGVEPGKFNPPDTSQPRNAPIVGVKFRYHEWLGAALGETMNWKALGRGVRWITAISILLATLWAPAPLRGQAGSAAPSTQRKTSTPYTGDLSIFETPGRDERLQINRVMDMLGIEPGKNVADIGAGSGWFTVRAARRVTNSGTVYAVDINPEAIRYIDQRAKKEHLQNIKTILSNPDNSELPADSIDAVLLLKAYHEVARPVVLLRNLRSSLKPGAKIGIIDRNGNGENHGVSKDVIVREAAQAGYELRDSQDFVKADGVDYFLIFTAKPD